ncbi:MAG: hypothetical protein QM713_12985 [Arachnia sp.]
MHDLRHRILLGGFVALWGLVSWDLAAPQVFLPLPVLLVFVGSGLLFALFRATARLVLLHLATLAVIAITADAILQPEALLLGPFAYLLLFYLVWMLPTLVFLTWRGDGVRGRGAQLHP